MRSGSDGRNQDVAHLRVIRLLLVRLTCSRHSALHVALIQRQVGVSEVIE